MHVRFRRTVRVQNRCAAQTSRYPFLHYRCCAKGQGESFSGARRDRGHRGGPKGGANPRSRQEKMGIYTAGKEREREKKNKQEGKVIVVQHIHVSIIIQYAYVYPIVPVACP